MKKFLVPAALAAMVFVGCTSADAKVKTLAPVVQCKEAKSGGCRGKVDVAPPQRLDILMAKGGNQQARCDDSGGVLVVIKKKTICQGVDY
jgi:hypothetical protein